LEALGILLRFNTLLWLAASWLLVLPGERISAATIDIFALTVVPGLQELSSAIVVLARSRNLAAASRGWDRRKRDNALSIRSPRRAARAR